MRIAVEERNIFGLFLMAVQDVVWHRPKSMLPSSSALSLEITIMNGVPAVAPIPKTVYVSFSAEIVPHTTESLIALLANQVNQGVQVVHLLLSTPGGSVMHGMNLYNILRGLPLELITHNVGNVDSIGNAVFLAGEKRYAAQHSTFMFHGRGL